MSDEPNVVSFFAKHLVVLSWVDRTPGERAEANDGQGKPFFISAFLLEVEGIWLIVTAGHVLEAIETAIANGQRFERWLVHDGLSPSSVHRQGCPFPIDGVTRTHWHDSSGADYGLIVLPMLYRSMLEANGKRPITRQAWEQDMPENFDGYLMLGLPSTFQREIVTPDNFQVEVFPTVIPVVTYRNSTHADGLAESMQRRVQRSEECCIVREAVEKCKRLRMVVLRLQRMGGIATNASLRNPCSRGACSPLCGTGILPVAPSSWLTGWKPVPRVVNTGSKLPGYTGVTKRRVAHR